MRPQNFQQRLKPLWTVLFSHYLQRHRDWKFIEEPKWRTLFIQKSLHEYCQSSWPEKRALDISITPYWKVRGSITVQGGLLLYNPRIIVPRSLQREILNRIHEGHQGIERCRMHTKTSVWWPGISSQITTLVENCPTCVMENKHRREPLMMTKIPEYPWQVLATDLFELEGEHYLLVSDYFS